MGSSKLAGKPALFLIAACALAGCSPVGDSVQHYQETAYDQDASAIGPGFSGTVSPTGSRPLTVAEKSDIYARAAGMGAEQLLRSITDIHQENGAAHRRESLNAMIQRLGEIDPAQAIRAIFSVDDAFDVEVLEPIFAAVARDKPGTAIEALATLGARQEYDALYPLAMTVLGEIGDEPRFLQAWLQAVPDVENQRQAALRIASFGNLRMEGFRALANADPALALDQLLSLSDNEARDYGIYRLADIVAADDPLGALNRIEATPDLELRSTMRFQVLSSWAALEPEAALNYVAALETWERIPNLSRDYSLRSLAEKALSSGIDPLAILSISRQMPVDRAEDVRYAALEALARRDPVTTGNYLDEIPANKRLGIARTVAYGYAEIDPSAAFSWARQQEAPDLEQHVLTHVARNNTDLALDFALDSGIRSRANALATVIVESVRFHPEDAQRLADRLAQSLAGSALYEASVSNLAGTWIQRDAEAAVQWLTSPGIDLPVGTYAAAARAWTNDPALAATLSPRIPAEAREHWIEQVVSNYVRNDLEGAVAWIEGNRHNPDYAPGALAAVASVAEFDTARAAELFANLPARADPQRVRNAAASLGWSWTQSDPHAAAAWAFGLRDDFVREPTVTNVTMNWAMRDPEAARTWILRQSPGTDRDNSLRAYLSVSSEQRLPDADLFSQFSTDQARTQAISGTILSIASRDPIQARTLLDRLNLSPDVRERTELMLDRIQEIKQRNPGSGEGLSTIVLAPPVPTTRE